MNNIIEFFKQKDKQLHIFVSILIYTFIVYILNIFIKNEIQILCYAVLFTLLIGIIKELYDESKENNKFDFYDIVADIVGINIGIIITVSVLLIFEQ